ncbi:restriction endonuclease subunit S [Rhodopirellula bahusiensis]|uniref:Restriction endonuclease subunit S n=1 Tax=Rhodopirellula bahusiensis TaxID=2014065 RepID=A0A2G1W285_9BACT|nr:restriction endonuclease subunit S [Rhodopirellula bahusiensis]PHQ33148.1 restriction endonuclease subunit S [Rhodopirellula bahusiensis]
MSFPAYEHTKESGVPWIGKIPLHWEIWQSRRLFSLRNERVREGDEQLTASQDHGVIPQKTFMELEGRSVVQVILNSEILKHVEPGDFVISMRSFQGGIEYAEHGGCISSAYVMLIPAKRIYGPFYKYLFKSQTYIQALQSTTNLVRDGQALRFQNFVMVDLPLVPVDEQKAIASFLDVETSKIDRLVSEQCRLIELLKEKRLAIISHAVTKGLNSNAPMKPSGIQWLGDVPQHWAIAKFGRIAFMQEGPGLRKWQFTDDGTLVICVTNITENGIDFSSFKKFISTEEYEEKYQHFTVERGDILLSSSGNSWGKVAVYDDDERVMLNTSTIRINALRNGDATRDFLQIALQSIAIREQLGVAMTGSCQPNFGPTHLNTVVIALPPPDEQAETVKYLEERLEKFSQLQAEAERAIDLLQERRTALISAAVTGKIDVRGFVSEEAAA